MNNTVTLAFRLGKKSVIGDYSVVFYRRSEFLYKALSDLGCYCLRKNRLYSILETYPYFATQIKKTILNRYLHLIRKPVLEHMQSNQSFT